MEDGNSHSSQETKRRDAHRIDYGDSVGLKKHVARTVEMVLREGFDNALPIGGLRTALRTFDVSSCRRPSDMKSGQLDVERI